MQEVGERAGEGAGRGTFRAVNGGGGGVKLELGSVDDVTLDGGSFSPDCAGVGEEGVGQLDVPRGPFERVGEGCSTSQGCAETIPKA